jgi:four helix bundle protein
MIAASDGRFFVSFVSSQLPVVSSWSLAVVLSFGEAKQNPLFCYSDKGGYMERTNFEKPRVYRLSEKLADELWKNVTRWSYFERDTVGKQLVRAGDSIGANIAEGAGRGRFLDNRRFVRMARGSLNETKHWLRRAHKRGLLTAAQTVVLKPVIDELAPMLNAYLNSIGSTSVKAKIKSDSLRTSQNY